ncbi:MAG: helicase-associated domain-containing protein [Rhodoglobus sp.]
MPDVRDSALVLAGALRSMPDTELSELLKAREVRTTGIHDFFDLADALLEADSIQLALGRLDRASLIALGEAPVAPDQLNAAAQLGLLVEHDGRVSVPAAVASQLSRWPSLGLPSAEELRTAPPPAALMAVSDDDSERTNQVAAEHAFATSMEIAELIVEVQHEPARILARGGTALPDSKRLASVMSVDVDRVAELIDIASRAGLVAANSSRWVPSDSSGQWLSNSFADRWSQLADGWLARLPHDIRTLLASRAHSQWGERLREYIDWLFPAGGEWMHDRVKVYTRDAELLGITANQLPSTPGIALLAGENNAAALMGALFPREVDKVYLQHDLSIVSPGPLSPALDARLRSMADVEGRALASSYRLTPASLARALASGETGESIAAFLSELSLTGIPQPVAYLVSETAARHGLVRVGPLAEGGSYIATTDAAILRTLAVDHGLAALRLTRIGERLETRADLEQTFWMLQQAHYPVTAENAAGDLVVLARKHTSRAATASGKDAVASLIEKLRLGSSTDSDLTGTAWIARQLDVAIRTKASLTITVLMPDGATVDYLLSPSSIAGGRLRALDRKADIERTLPLASITTIGPA